MNVLAKNTKKFSEKLKNWALLLGVVMVMAVLAELVLRLVFPQEQTSLPGATNLGTLQRKSDIPGLYWAGNPNYSSEKYQLNSAGFRGREFSREKPDSTLRLALIGDSVTFGLGVHQPDSIYATLLENMLQNYGNIEVLNFGVPGYNTWQEFIQLKEIVLEYSPDIVMLGFFFNDADGLTSIATADGLTQFGSEKKKPSGAGFTNFVKKSRLVLALKNLVEQIGVAAFDYYPNYIDLKIKSARWAEMKAELAKMRRFLDDRKIPFIVTVFPVSYQLKYEESESAAQTDLTGFLRSENIAFINLFEPFKQFLAANDFDYFKLLVKGLPDSHPTEAGHHVAAETIRQNETFLNFLNHSKSKGEAHE